MTLLSVVTAGPFPLVLSDCFNNKRNPCCDPWTSFCFHRSNWIAQNELWVTINPGFIYKFSGSYVSSTLDGVCLVASPQRHVLLKFLSYWRLCIIEIFIRVLICIAHGRLRFHTSKWVGPATTAPFHEVLGPVWLTWYL